jgi:hypothetical protein
LWKGAATGGDPHFAQVVLLMGFNGTNGSTGAPGMTDESPAAHGTATIAGSGAVISTTQKQFGASSLSLDGASSITFPDSNDWNLAAGQFTVECWFYTNTVTGNFHFIVGQWDSGALSLGWILSVNNATPSWNISTVGSNNIFQLDSAPTTVTTGTWHHVAVDYDGIKYRFYLDGITTKTTTTPVTIFDSTNKLVIGSNNGNDFSWFNGYIDELRITKGFARYATDTSFTVPIAAFPRS